MGCLQSRGHPLPRDTRSCDSLMVDHQRLANNIGLLIGGLLVLTVLIITTIAAVTGIKMLVWRAKQRKEEREYYEVTRRADGRKYPPSIPGSCSLCRRGHDTIYHPTGHEGLCPSCYELYWREEEAWTDPKPENATTD
jgi:hypothetical protein